MLLGVLPMMTDQRAMIDLRYISSGCERMRKLEFGDDDEALRERMALRLEWDDAIGQLPTIVDAYEHGGLSMVTVAKLRDVAQDVTALLPEIERIRFRMPDAEALARARQDTPARTA